MRNPYPLVIAVAATVLVVCFTLVATARGQIKDVRPQLDRSTLLNPLKPIEPLSGKSFPVQISRTVSLPTSQQSTVNGLYTVPTGYRLVIEYISFSITAQVRDDVAVARLRVGAGLNGSMIYHDVFTLGGSRLYLGDSQVVKLYADPGTTVQTVIEREFRPPSSARISFSGYLEPVASAPKLQRVG